MCYTALAVRSFRARAWGSLDAVLSTLGRYEVLRPLATGGMATVYLGRVSAAGGFERLVAIKVMHPHIAGDPEFVTMFLDEARLAARIRHPNVVATHDVDQSPDGLFLVMDYVDGPPLHLVVKAVAKQRQAIPHEVLLRIFSDVLEGLHAAHELTDEAGNPLGLVHRDVSPHNVLLGTDGVARLTDFGVAHARSRLTTTQGASLKGKVAYLSPEQVLVGTVDRRSDVFSAGVVLWEALTRRRLFKGSTEGQTLTQIIAGAQAAPASIDPTIPGAISDACMKALAKDPSERYATAIEFADALDAAARSAGLVIAKPRQVAAFLATLDVPEPSVQLPASHELSARRVGDALAAALPPPSNGEPSATVGGSLVTPIPSVKPKRGRGLLLASVGMLAVGAAGALVLLPRLRAPASEPAEPAAAALPSATAARSAETLPPPEPAAPDAAAAPAASAAASASATPAPAPTSASPSPSRPVAPGPAAPARTPKPSATSYKPSEL